jgi:hypothetical protein
VITNLVWLAYTAWHLERVLGWRSLLVLYTASVAGGSLLSMVGAPFAPSLGASGGIFGLIAAIVVFGFTRPELLTERARRVFGFALLPYLLLMLASGAMNAETDNFAHLGGLLTGGTLALLADPPGRPRRAGWNTRWQVATLGAIGALLLAVFVAGPRVEQLERPEVVRAAQRARSTGERQEPAPPPEDGPTWLVPAGWGEATTADGTPGWTSPLGRRAWAVSASVEGAPVTPEALRDRVVARLEREGWTVELGPLEPATVAGLPGVRAHGLLRGAGPGVDDPTDLALTWQAVVRGVQTLVTVWQVEPALEARLAPLQARLEASVAWPDPLELRQAEALLAADPTRADVRRQLGTALAAVGRVDEAITLQRALVAESPTSRRDRLALLRTLAWYPTAIADLDAVLDEALAAGLGPQVTAAVADVLDGAHRSDLARGLLELAAARAPGERTIGKARTVRGVSNDLHPRLAIPLTTWWDLAADRPRDEAAITALSEAPLTVAAAAPVGAALAAARADLARLAADELRHRSYDLVPTLVLLALGHPALDARTGFDEIRHGVDVAAEGAPPPWWLPELPPAAELKAFLAPLPDEAGTARVPLVR